MKSVIFLLLMVFVAVPFAGRLVITNDTGSYDFLYIYISPSASDSWGGDKLGADEIVSPGDSRTFRLGNGLYDVRITDEDGDDYIFWNVDLSGTVGINVDLGDLGEQNWGTPSQSSVSEGSAAVTIENDLGDWSIYYIYCDRSEDPWSDNDRLGSEILDPGEATTFYVPANETYDIRCVDEDGDTYTIWNVYADESEGIYWSVDLSDMD